MAIVFSLIFPLPAFADIAVTIHPLPYVSALDTPINEVPENVQVIKSQDVEEQNNLSVGGVLLNNVNGVNINDAAGNPYQPDVNYHGFTASPLLGTPVGLSVYQDGVRVNEPFGDIVNWDLIPENAIASTTLIPGSNPIYGLNTLGGAIELQTKDGIHNPGTEAQISGGSWGRRQADAETGGSSGGFNWFFAGNGFAEDGWRQLSPSDVGQGFGKLAWKNDKSDFEISFTGADNDLTGLGYTPKSMLNTIGWNSILTSPDVTKNQLGFVSAKGGYWVEDHTYLSSNIYFRSSSAQTINGNVNGDYNDTSGVNYPFGNIVAGTDFNTSANTYTSTQQSTAGIGVQASFNQDIYDHKNQLSTGIDYAHSGVAFNETYAEGTLSSDRVSTDILPAIPLVALNGTDDALGLYATDNFSIISGTNLTLSGRYNDTEVATTDQLNGPGPNSLTGQQAFQSFNPAIGLTHDFNDELNVYGNVEQGSRAPSSIEIGCSNPVSPCALPNALAGDPPTLKQVIARTYEAGLRGKAFGNVDWSIGGYRTLSRDDIEFIASNTSGAGYFTNVGETLRQGIDTSAQIKINDFKFSLGYSYIDATYQSAFQIANSANSTNFTNAAGTQVIQVNKGDQIPGIPQNQVKLRGEWQARPEWTIGGDVLGFSSQWAHGDENNADPTGNIPGYAVVNLDTRYSVPNTGLQLFANVNNLFNTHYANGGLLGTNNFYANGQFRSDGTTTNEPFLSPGSP
ncbi:MAG: TonB-dependent receptor, partial [Alphaproteobacteria bacterium]